MLPGKMSRNDVRKMSRNDVRNRNYGFGIYLKSIDLQFLIFILFTNFPIHSFISLKVFFKCI